MQRSLIPFTFALAACSTNDKLVDEYCVGRNYVTSELAAAMAGAPAAAARNDQAALASAQARVAAAQERLKEVTAIGRTLEGRGINLTGLCK